MDETRLIDLESRMAWQDEALRELSDALARQQRDIERLQRLCLALQSQLESAGDGQRAAQAHEPPPHY
jgi:SlyX protein